MVPVKQVRSHAEAGALGSLDGRAARLAEVGAADD